MFLGEAIHPRWKESSNEKDKTKLYLYEGTEEDVPDLELGTSSLTSRKTFTVTVPIDLDESDEEST